MVKKKVEEGAHTAHSVSLEVTISDETEVCMQTEEIRSPRCHIIISFSFLLHLPIDLDASFLFPEKK